MTTQTPDAVREAVHIIQNMQKRLLWQIAFVFAAHHSRYVIGFWDAWLLARDAWDESDSGDCDPADAFREISYEWEF